MATRCRQSGNATRARQHRPPAAYLTRDLVQQRRHDGLPGGDEEIPLIVLLGVLEVVGVHDPHHMTDGATRCGRGTRARSGGGEGEETSDLLRSPSADTHPPITGRCTRVKWAGSPHRPQAMREPQALGRGGEARRRLVRGGKLGAGLCWNRGGGGQGFL